MSVFPTVSCITLYLIPSKSTSLSAKKKKVHSLIKSLLDGKFC